MVIFIERFTDIDAVGKMGGCVTEKLPVDDELEK